LLKLVEFFERSNSPRQWIRLPRSRQKVWLPGWTPAIRHEIHSPAQVAAENGSARNPVQTSMRTLQVSVRQKPTGLLTTTRMVICKVMIAQAKKIRGTWEAQAGLFFNLKLILKESRQYSMHRWVLLQTMD
jgi:hypothetical protein